MLRNWAKHSTNVLFLFFKSRELDSGDNTQYTSASGGTLNLFVADWLKNYVSHWLSMKDTISTT